MAECPKSDPQEKLGGGTPEEDPFHVEPGLSHHSTLLTRQCHALYEKARGKYDQKRYCECRELCLSILKVPYLPRIARCRTLQLIAGCSYFFDAKTYLEEVFEICDQMVSQELGSFLRESTLKLLGDIERFRPEDGEVVAYIRELEFDEELNFDDAGSHDEAGQGPKENNSEEYSRSLIRDEVEDMLSEIRKGNLDAIGHLPGLIRRNSEAAGSQYHSALLESSNEQVKALFHLRKETVAEKGRLEKERNRIGDETRRIQEEQQSMGEKLNHVENDLKWVQDMGDNLLDGRRFREENC